MAISLKPEHLSRYKDIARLLVRHGRSDLLAVTGLDEVCDDEAGVADDAADLAADLESMGPTFVKLGQLLSTRADLLPAPYLDALARLQDRCEPISVDEVKSRVEQELGVRIGSLFADFDDVPLAAASLAQVHRATLRDGRSVAVKVLRPGVEQRARVDLEAIAELAEFVERRTKAGRKFDLGAMVDEFRRTMLGELDLRREAANLRELGADLAEFPAVFVPQPIEDFTTGKVLTMEFVAGRKITDIGPVGMVDVDGEPLASALFDAYLHQLLVTGFFHADPHPGNVLLTDDCRLALIDLGMVARLQPELQDRVVRLLVAASSGKGTEAATHAIALGTPEEDFDRDQFVRLVSDVVAEHNRSRLDRLPAGAIVVELTRAAGECGLRPAVELTMVGKALLNLDEVARHLAPRFDPNAELRARAASLFERRMTSGLSASAVLSAALDAKEFAEKLPSRVNKVLDTFAEGELRLQVKGIDEREFIRGAEKVANRVTMGLVLAALIVGAATLARVAPRLATICFVLAATGGVALMATILIGDRRDNK